VTAVTTRECCGLGEAHQVITRLAAVDSKTCVPRLALGWSRSVMLDVLIPADLRSTVTRITDGAVRRLRSCVAKVKLINAS